MLWLGDMELDLFSPQEEPKINSHALVGKVIRQVSTNARWWLVAILFLLLVSVQASAQDMFWRKYMEDGAKAHREGRYAEAEESWRAAVKEAERFGAEDQRVFLSFRHLLDLYHAQGRYAEAEPLAKRSLVIVEKITGPDHPLVAQSLNNLAGLNYALGIR